MKKYIVLFLVSITVIIFNSCEKNYPTQNQNQDYSLLKPNVIYLTGLNPTNIANPVDSCGYYHNLFLTIFINNTQITAYDTNLYKEAIFDIMGQIGDDNIFETNRVINQYAFEFYYDSVNGLSNNQIIEKYSINSYVKSKLYNLFAILQEHTDTLHFNIDSINTITNEIKSWEQLVMQELNYYNYNPNDSIANQLLITSSILRYSLCFWITAINDPNSALRNLFPTNKLNPKFVNNKIQSFETLLGVGAALYITGCDGVGAIAGAERPKLDENGQQIKNPDGTPVMETVRGVDGAVLASSNGCKDIWNWFIGIFK